MVAPNKRIKMFNKLLNEFLDAYDKLYNVQTPRTKIRELKVLNTFKDEINYVREAFFNCDESSFKNITLCKTIKLDERENFTLQNRLSIWKYLHNLYILTHEAPDKGTIMADAKAAISKLEANNQGATNTNIMSQLLSTVLPMAGNLGNLGNIGNIGTTGASVSADQLPTEIPQELAGLIQDIAGQVSETLQGKDVSNINPMELFSSLMSGQGNTTVNGIDFSSILKNTTEKVQQQISEGKLDITKLKEQTQTLISDPGIMKAASNLNLNVNDTGKDLD